MESRRFSLLRNNLTESILKCLFAFIAPKLSSGLPEPLGLLFLRQLFTFWF